MSAVADARPARLRAMRDLVIRLRKSSSRDVDKVDVQGHFRTAASRSCSGGIARLAGQRMRPAASDADRADLERVLPTSSPTRSSCPSGPLTSSPRAACKGRLLTAGFHLMQGYFRDDAPLCELVLDEAGRRELDALWQELDFVTLAPDAAVQGLHLLRACRAAAVHDGGRRSTSPARKTKTRPPTPRSSNSRAAYLAKARKIGASDEADRGDRDLLRRDLRRDPPGRAGPAGRRAEPPGGARDVRRRAYRRPLSPAEQRRTARLLSRAPRTRMGWATRTRSATRSPAC